MYRMDGAPYVSDLVFEQSSREWKDPVDRLSQLEYHGIVPSVVVKLEWQRRKQRRKRKTLLWNAHVLVVCDAQDEREVEQGERCHGNDGDKHKASNVELGEHAYTKEVGKDGRRVEEGHLLESKRAHEEDAAPEVATRKNAGHCRNSKAEHDGVVLKVSMVNEHCRRLHEDGNQRDGCLPDIDLFRARVSAEEYDDSRDVYEVFGYEDGSPHVYLQRGVVEAAGVEEGEPGRIDGRTTGASLSVVISQGAWLHLHDSQEPAVVGSQGGIVQAPPPQVVEIPRGHGELLGEFHPMSLGLKVSMHGRRLEARVSPEPGRPSEEAHGHQYQRDGGPLRNGAFGRPQEGNERKRGLSGIAGIEIERAMGDEGEGALFNLPAPPGLVDSRGHWYRAAAAGWSPRNDGSRVVGRRSPRCALAEPMVCGQ